MSEPLPLHIEEKIEALEIALQNAMNFMTGMAMDPRLPQEARDSLRSRADEIEAKLEEFA